VYVPKSEYYELPNKYEKTTVRLLVQSPTRIFVYWDVSNDSIKEFESHNNNYSNSVPTLKIKNLTMNYSYDVKIDPFANNYYIEVKDPNCEYQVELGRVSNNHFVNIYTSNTAKLPRNAPVALADSEEIIYRNCIRLDVSEKFTIYYKNPNSNYRIDGTSQNYLGLAFGDDNISSMNNVSSYTRYDKWWKMREFFIFLTSFLILEEKFMDEKGYLCFVLHPILPYVRTNWGQSLNGSKIKLSNNDKYLKNFDPIRDCPQLVHIFCNL